jgi:thymidylate synthase ThyX
LDDHAQWEFRQYAQKIWDIVRAIWPITAEAFENYRLASKTFSKRQLDRIRELAGEEPDSKLAAYLIKCLE